MHILQCLNWVQIHKCHALEANCNKYEKVSHEKAYRQMFKNNRALRKLTEEELVEPKKNMKHYTATVIMNRLKEEFIKDGE